MKNNNIKEITIKYFELFPEDKKNNLNLLKQLETGEDMFDRKNFNGHIAANALIINKDKVLVIFHKILKSYLQPGGHVEKIDENIIESAKRELEEETGIHQYNLHEWHIQNDNIPIFIIEHTYPKNETKNEEEHYHYDFMYIFHTDENEANIQLEEVSKYRWIPIKDFLEKDNNPFIVKSLKKMQKLKLLQ